jgi:hypothetical protein
VAHRRGPPLHRRRRLLPVLRVSERLHSTASTES